MFTALRVCAASAGMLSLSGNVTECKAVYLFLLALIQQWSFFSAPGFARNQKLLQERGGCGDLKGELLPLLGSITSIICFAITGVFGSWYRGKFFYSWVFSTWRNKGLCREEEGEGRGGRCLSKGHGEHLCKSNFLSPLPLLCEHPPYLPIPSPSLSFLAWPKWRWALLSQGWFQRCSTAVCHWICGVNGWVWPSPLALGWLNWKLALVDKLTAVLVEFHDPH